jgi:hypothetical protein
MNTTEIITIMKNNNILYICKGRICAYYNNKLKYAEAISIMNAKLDNEHFIYLSSNNKDIIGGITSLGSAIILKLNKRVKTIKSFSKISKNKYENEYYNYVNFKYICTSPTVIKLIDNLYKEISCFKDGGVLLTKNGSIKIYNFGESEYFRGYKIPLQLENDEKYISVACGHSHIVLLKNNNTVVSYGWNKYGQCNIPPLIDNTYYTQIGCHPLLNSTILLRNDRKCIYIGKDSINFSIDNYNFDFSCINYNYLLLFKNNEIYFQNIFHYEKKYIINFLNDHEKINNIFFIEDIYNNDLILILDKFFEYKNKIHLGHEKYSFDL